MKKILIAIMVLFATTASVQAQFSKWGVRLGVGFANHADDLSAAAPILGANAGVFVDYAFSNASSYTLENMTLQTGVNIIRRGSNIEEVLEKGLNLSYRAGYYHAYYAQIPILAQFKYELPIRDPNHNILFSIGPAVSIGLAGTYYDRKVSPFMPQRTWNYKIKESAFDYMNRIDANFLMGVGYEHQDLIVMLQLDYGFLAVSQSTDALKESENQSATSNKDKVNAVVPNGNNWAILLTVGYQIPIR